MTLTAHLLTGDQRRALIDAASLTLRSTYLIPRDRARLEGALNALKKGTNGM